MASPDNHKERYANRFDLESEKSVLGAILLDNALAYQAIDLLHEGDDLFPPHKKIFAKMVSLANRNERIDLHTLRNELKDDFTKVGGATFIASLIDGVPHTDTITPHVKIIKEKSKLRRLTSISNLISKLVEDGDLSADDIIEKAKDLIFEISNIDRLESAEHVATVAAKLADFYEEKSRDASSLIGISTGYVDLDKRLSGLQQLLYILAGRTGHAKTATAINIACNVAFNGDSVYYASPESSKNQLVQRVLASQSRIDSGRMKEGRMDRDEWGRLLDTLGRLATTNFFVDDKADLTPETLFSRCKQHKLTTGLDLIVLDYIQLMARRLVGSPKSKYRDLRSAVQHVTTSLIEIGRVLQVPIIALSQVGREVDSRPGHRPILSDLQESSSVEQDGDVVIFLLREEKYDPRPDNNGILKLIFGKFRDGSTAEDIDMAFIEQFTKVESLWKE